MSAERPIIWLGSTAAIVGLFVAFAVCQSGRPGVITLNENRPVVFAMSHDQAVAKAATLQAPARLAVVRNVHLTKPALPKSRLSRSLPQSSEAVIVAARAASAAVVSSGGTSPLLRGLQAHARAYQSQCLVPVQQVAPVVIAQFVPRVMDVLSTARSLRGPPAV